MVKVKTEKENITMNLVCKYLEESKICNGDKQQSNDLIGVYDSIKRLLEKEGKLYGYQK